MNFLYVLTAHPGNIWIVSMMFDLFTVLKHFCLFDHEKSHHPIHLALYFQNHDLIPLIIFPYDIHVLASEFLI